MVSNKELQLLDRKLIDYTMLLKVYSQNRKIMIGSYYRIDSYKWSPEIHNFPDVIYLYIYGYHREYDVYKYDLADR